MRLEIFDAGSYLPALSLHHLLEAHVPQTLSPLRAATIEDASVLVELVNHAGEGLPLYLWGNLAEDGESAWDVGRARAARESGGFSYRNAIMIDHEEQPAGCLIGYSIPEIAESVDPETPPMFRPLQELENLAPGTWYVNVLAVLPAFRNLGLGTVLLDLADETGRKLGAGGMSLIVSDANPDARRLYERCGYVARAERAMVKEGWVNDGQNWILMTKDL